MASRSWLPMCLMLRTTLLPPAVSLYKAAPRILGAKVMAIALPGLLTMGCSTMALEDIAMDEPAFSFTEFFQGDVRASGFFTSRLGSVSQHFCGDFFGTEKDGDLRLDETLNYTSGLTEKRVWQAEETPDGRFTATADSLEGPVDGQIQGNTLAMKYTMEVLVGPGPDDKQTFDMKDYMFLQPDGTLQNLTKVYKWGIRVGYVSTVFIRHDGSDSCEARTADGGTAA